MAAVRSMRHPSHRDDLGHRRAAAAVIRPAARNKSRLASGTAHKKCRMIRYIWPGPRAFLRDTLVPTSIQPAARPSQADSRTRSDAPVGGARPARPRGQGDPRDSSLPLQWPYLFFLPAGGSFTAVWEGSRGGGKRAAALNHADGTSTVPGPDGRGIPPGKYRVSVTQKYRTKHTVNKPKKLGTAPIDRDTDLLGERFSPTGSPSSSR